MKKITLALIEDTPELIRSVSRNISCFENLQLLFTASNGEEALKKLASADQLPQVILMDINMPKLNGIETTRRIHNLYPDVKVIMHTVFDADDKIFESILAGASGYLLKDSFPGQLAEAIEEAIDGGAPMSPAIATKALKLIRNQTPPVSSSEADTEDFNLSKRELEILEKLSSGLSYQQIADQLFVSPKTVRKHIENIYRKLQVHNKIQAIEKARRNRLLSLLF